MTRTKSIHTYHRTCIEWPCSRTIPADSEEMRCPGCKAKREVEDTAAWAYAKHRRAATDKAEQLLLKLVESKPWAGGDATWTDVGDMQRVERAVAEALAMMGKP